MMDPETFYPMVIFVFVTVDMQSYAKQMENMVTTVLTMKSLLRVEPLFLWSA